MKYSKGNQSNRDDKVYDGLAKAVKIAISLPDAARETCSHTSWCILCPCHEG